MPFVPPPPPPAIIRPAQQSSTQQSTTPPQQDGRPSDNGQIIRKGNPMWRRYASRIQFNPNATKGAWHRSLKSRSNRRKS